MEGVTFIGVEKVRRMVEISLDFLVFQDYNMSQNGQEVSELVVEFFVVVGE